MAFLYLYIAWLFSLNPTHMTQVNINTEEKMFQVSQEYSALNNSGNRVASI